MNKDEYIKKLEDDLSKAHSKIKSYEKILSLHGLLASKEDSKNKTYTTSEKLNIFMDYFKGREDVYAERWESKEKSGYSPVYKREYRYLSKDQKKLIEYDELYKPITKDIFVNHLKGNITLGLYPMLENQTCYFIAVDFDEATWRKDVLAFKSKSIVNGFDCLVEISRSGKGAHAWIFFEEAISAQTARRLGRFLLTDTMNDVRSISLNSYDRMFPTQDYITEKQIGNLIALPLHGKSGKIGNTLFVDGELVPFENQYDTLSNIKKITIPEIDKYFELKKSKNDIGPLSTNLKDLDINNLDFQQPFIITVDNEIIVEKSILNHKSKQYVMRSSSISNPQFYKNEKMRLSNFNVPRIIELYRETSKHLYLPVGILKNIIGNLNDKSILYEIDDLRKEELLSKKIRSTIKLRPKQNDVLNQLKNHNSGIIVAPTGFGKTVIGIELITRLKQKTLIITNRVNLCEQWVKQIKVNTNVSDVGRLFGKYKDIKYDIDVATFQSLLKYKNIDKVVSRYGLIIIDEVHHLAAYSFEKVIRKFSAKYIYGLTATPKRADGLEKITQMLLGEIIVEVKIDNSLINKSLVTHFTNFKTIRLDHISGLLKELINDITRNQLILHDISEEIKQKKNILVLTDRIEHLDILRQSILKYTDNLFVIHGKMGNKQKNKFKEDIEKVNSNFVILSTGKFIGEGFDERRLDTLFLTMPFRWRGTLSQYVGRLNRVDGEIKYITVHDYVDIHVKMFSNMYIERLKGYKSQGFNVLLTVNSKQCLFNYNEYDVELKKDLSHSNNSVMFIVNYFHNNRLEKLIKESNKIPNIINPKEDLQESTYKYLNIIIIDESIIWYGPINPFVFKKDTDSTILRIEDSILAKSIINGIKMKL